MNTSTDLPKERAAVYLPKDGWVIMFAGAILRVEILLSKF